MNLTWKQLEQLCMYRMDAESKRGQGAMKRAGVTCAELYGRGELNKDRVDFEGNAGDSWAPFKMEVKTCSLSSFTLDEAHFKRGQYDELKAFDGVSFVLLHFNERRMVRKSVESKTYAFPVWPGHAFWFCYESGVVKSITRYDCSQNAIEVPWNTLPGRRKLSPDIVMAVENVMDMRKLQCSS